MPPGRRRRGLRGPAPRGRGMIPLHPHPAMEVDEKNKRYPRAAQGTPSKLPGARKRKKRSGESSLSPDRFLRFLGAFTHRLAGKAGRPGSDRYFVTCPLQRHTSLCNITCFIRKGRVQGGLPPWRVSEGSALSVLQPYSPCSLSYACHSGA